MYSHVSYADAVLYLLMREIEDSHSISSHSFGTSASVYNGTASHENLMPLHTHLTRVSRVGVGSYSRSWVSLMPASSRSSLTCSATQKLCPLSTGTDNAPAVQRCVITCVDRQLRVVKHAVSVKHTLFSTRLPLAAVRYVPNWHNRLHS